MFFPDNNYKIALYDTAYEAVRELLELSNDLTLLDTLNHIRQQRRKFIKTIKPLRYVEFSNTSIVPRIPDSRGASGEHP